MNAKENGASPACFSVAAEEANKPSEQEIQEKFDAYSRSGGKAMRQKVIGNGGTGAGLVALGIALIVAEAFLPTFGIVGLGGVAAIVTGAVIMYEAGSMPAWFNWGFIWGIAFCGLAVVGLTAYLTAKVYKQKLSTGPESMVGGKAQIVEWSGTRGRVRVQGEIWSAFSDEAYDLKKDDEVLVCKVEGLEIKIRAVE